MEIRTNPNFNAAYNNQQKPVFEAQKTKNCKIDNNDVIILQGGMVIYV